MRTRSLITAGTLVLVACQGSGEQGAPQDTASPATSGMDSAGTGSAPAAGGVSVAMRDASGRELGTLTLAEAGTGLTISGTLRGLPPGPHAIHVHTVGRCEGPKFESAGGHWNPTQRQHGSENPQGPHFGDMPNLTVAADSTVTVQASTAGGTLRGESAALDTDGAAVVIHAGADDYRTDPSGSSGDRIACGVAGA